MLMEVNPSDFSLNEPLPCKYSFRTYLVIFLKGGLFWGNQRPILRLQWLEFLYIMEFCLIFFVHPKIQHSYQL